ncbi:hypothetical protein CR969_00035 [Candidatus Saccharibacteria bacterium]|nr:MAG: hypothetical protein CR969_00035 [Candidatus Saccharibacteria bacterium]
MNFANDQSNGPVGAPNNNQNQSLTPVNPATDSQQQAAAGVIRGQIDAIYNQSEYAHPVTPAQAPSPAPEPTPQPQPIQPAPEPQPAGHGLRTAPPEPEPEAQETVTQTELPSTIAHTAADHHPKADPDQWNQYHSAWQKYYQMYYERYYANHLHNKQQELSQFMASGQAAPVASAEDETISQETAIKELRGKIRNTVRNSTQKIKKSRHFVPIIAGVAVMLVFMFLQYNRIIFGAVAAYTTPGNIDPQNIIIDPTNVADVGPEPRMIIPKINIDGNVNYGVGADHKSQMKAMETGIAHFSIPGANAVPGQVGNAVFAAHSSNDVFAAGDQNYKFIFAQNEKLNKGDVIYMNYQGKRYTYSVTSKQVVLPNQIGKVQIKTKKPMLTLVSCVPLGTAEKRLLIFAEQISPDPDKAKVAQADVSQPESESLSGKPAPSLLERLFGAS